jgi:hypothetical protein
MLNTLKISETKACRKRNISVFRRSAIFYTDHSQLAQERVWVLSVSEIHNIICLLIFKSIAYHLQLLKQEVPAVLSASLAFLAACAQSITRYQTLMRVITKIYEEVKLTAFFSS